MRYAVIGSVFGLLLGAGVTFLALKRDPAKEPEPEEHASQRTVWTDRHEIFVEHPPLIAGEPAVFVTHVTDLESLEPRREGAIAYEFDGRVETSAAPIRPGIYTPTLTFSMSGHWKVELRIDESRIDLGSFEVHSSKAEAESHEHDEPEGITFLKEQQWKLVTRSEPVGTRKLVHRLRVPGVVTPRPGSRAALTSPVEGRLMAASGKALPALGERVEADQVLGWVQPPFSEFAAKLIE
ncbi:MAG TPA: hypothetical protein VJU16_08860, partial [Planctomycetota bacterium]|nr:hypothetical protein [Planctomycetota bacterium]